MIPPTLIPPAMMKPVGGATCTEEAGQTEGTIKSPIDGMEYDHAKRFVDFLEDRNDGLHRFALHVFCAA